MIKLEISKANSLHEKDVTCVVLSANLLTSSLIEYVKYKRFFYSHSESMSEIEDSMDEIGCRLVNDIDVLEGDGHSDYFKEYENSNILVFSPTRSINFEAPFEEAYNTIIAELEKNGIKYELIKK